MGHSADSTAVDVSPITAGSSSTLNPDDIAGVQSIWGPAPGRRLRPGQRQLHLAPTPPTSPRSSTAPTTRSSCPAWTSPARRDRTGSRSPPRPTPATTSASQVQSTNLSELSPKVQIYNASLQGLVQTAASANAYGATISASITNATPEHHLLHPGLGLQRRADRHRRLRPAVNMGTDHLAARRPAQHRWSPPSPTRAAARRRATGGGSGGLYCKSIGLGRIPETSSTSLRPTPPDRRPDLDRPASTTCVGPDAGPGRLTHGRPRAVQDRPGLIDRPPPTRGVRRRPSIPTPEGPRRLEIAVLADPCDGRPPPQA